MFCSVLCGSVFGVLNVSVRTRFVLFLIENRLNIVSIIIIIIT